MGTINYGIPQRWNAHQFTPSRTTLTYTPLRCHSVVATELSLFFVLKEVAFDLSIDSRTMVIDLPRDLGHVHLAMRKIFDRTSFS